MIKLIAAALWIGAVSLGSVFYAFQQADTAPQPVNEAEASPFGGLDYVRTDVISVPQLRGGEVQGYFLARMVFTADAERLRQLVLPAEALLTDAIYSRLYADPALDFSSIDTIDLEGLRSGLRTEMNARIGEDLIQEVLIEQVDFLSKADIRRASFRGWDTAVAAPTEAKADDAGGH